MTEHHEDTTLEKKKDLQLKMLCGKLKSQMGNQIYKLLEDLKERLSDCSTTNVQRRNDSFTSKSLAGSEHGKGLMEPYSNITGSAELHSTNLYHR